MYESFLFDYLSFYMGCFEWTTEWTATELLVHCKVRTELLMGRPVHWSVQKNTRQMLEERQEMKSRFPDMGVVMGDWTSELQK